MQTRRALRIISKGEKNYTGDPVGPLAGERSQYYLDKFNERQSKILAQKAEETFQLPFAAVLQQKLAKMLNREDPNMPMAAVFDVFQGMKRMADQAPTDRGLRWLTKCLAKHWAAEPDGALTTKEVTAIRNHVLSNYPRSKAAKALENEVSRIGFHRLPVAKLARIASHINTQQDYDEQVHLANLTDSKPQSVRARSLIRQLVALRDVKLAEEKAHDERTATERALDRVEREAQFDETMPPGGQGPENSPAPEMETPEEMMQAEPPPGAPPGPGGDSPQTDEAVDLIQQVEEFVEQTAPPEAEPYIQHEMSEGHEYPVGTAPWGFEEAEEGHTSPPPTEEWQQEEVEEIKGNPPSAGGMGHPPPGRETMGASKMAKGLDQPMPKGNEGPPQRQVQTYMPKPKEDGGTELKSASEIENDLLSGLTVTANNCSIRISESDEVELYVRGAGRACDLMYMDTAIQDFLKSASEAAPAPAPLAFEGAYRISKLVPVPCDRCASISYFPDVDGAEYYACDCGNKIAAAGVDMLVKTGQLEKEFRIEVALPHDANKASADARKRAIIRTVETAMPYAQMTGDEGNVVAFNVRNTDEAELRKVEHKLKAMGVQEFDARRWAQMMQPQTVVHAPGTADAQEVVPQGQAAPQPAAGGGMGDAPPTEGGTMKPEDIQAAFRHYKSMGLDLPGAWDQLRKDYKEKAKGWNPTQNAVATGVIGMLWAGEGATAETAQPLQTDASKKAQTLKGPAGESGGKDHMTPKPREQQPDRVKVTPEVLGTENSDGKDPGTMGAPKNIKEQHPMKGTGPLSNKNMNHGGPGTDAKDVGSFKAPKPRSDGHVPGAGDSPGTSKVKSRDLGRDSDTFGKGIPTPPGKIIPGRSM
jgi:hypothetical protein